MPEVFIHQRSSKGFRRRNSDAYSRCVGWAAGVPDASWLSSAPYCPTQKRKNFKRKISRAPPQTRQSPSRRRRAWHARLGSGSANRQGCRCSSLPWVSYSYSLTSKRNPGASLSPTPWPESGGWGQQKANTHHFTTSAPFAAHPRVVSDFLSNDDGCPSPIRFLQVGLSRVLSP